MEHNFLKTTFGKFMAAITLPSMMICFIAICYEFAKGRIPNLWGMIISLIGFGLFLKAKISVICKGKLISFGCDLMDQTNTNFYFVGWVLFIAGYFLTWI